MSDAASINSGRDRRWLILGVIGLAQLMVILDLTVMNIVLPSAQRALPARQRSRVLHLTRVAQREG
jgi:hypothetical protein